jgi:hypothetical protein
MLPQWSYTQTMQLPETIVCPVCFASLTSSANQVRCNGCGRVYPVIDGLPVLLPDRAAVPTLQA